MSGGAWSVMHGASEGAGRSDACAGPSTTATTAMTAGADFSALTKFFKPWVWHSVFVDLVCGQQPCFCAASRSCGQEKQFPQNSAAMISAAMAVVENVLIPVPLYTNFGVC